MGKQLSTLQHNLEAAVQRADAEGIESSEATGCAASDHFRGAMKMVAMQKIRRAQP